jgi:hypothetical protein
MYSAEDGTHTKNCGKNCYNLKLRYTEESKLMTKKIQITNTDWEESKN